MFPVQHMSGKVIYAGLNLVLRLNNLYKESVSALKVVWSQRTCLRSLEAVGQTAMNQQG